MSQPLDEDKPLEVEVMPIVPDDVAQDPNDHTGSDDPTVPNDGGVNTAATASVLESSIAPDNSHEDTASYDPAVNFGIEEEAPDQADKSEILDAGEAVDEDDLLDADHRFEQLVMANYSDDALDELKVHATTITFDDLDEEGSADKKLEAEFEEARQEAEARDSLTPVAFVGKLREYQKFTAREISFLAELVKEELLRTIDTRHVIPETFRPAKLLVALDAALYNLRAGGHWSMMHRCVIARDAYLGSESFSENFFQSFLLKHSREIDHLIWAGLNSWKSFMNTVKTFSPDPDSGTK
jgi:hypothetical protein